MRLTNPRLRFGRDTVAPWRSSSQAWGRWRCRPAAVSTSSGPVEEVGLLRVLLEKVGFRVGNRPGFAWATRSGVGGAGSRYRCFRVLWRREEQGPSTLRAAALEGLRAHFGRELWTLARCAPDLLGAPPRARFQGFPW